MIPAIFFTFSIISGQIIKFPIFGINGPTLLDLFVVLFSILGSLQLKFKFKTPPLSLKIFFVFLIICLISLLMTPLHLNFSGYLFSFSYIARLFFFLLFALTVYSNAFSFQKYLPEVFIYSGLGLAILGILQLIFIPNLLFLQSSGWDPHVFRTVSTFLDPNFAGAYFSLTLFIIIDNIFRDKKNYKKPIIFLGIIFIALLTTFSRSSYLMFLLGGITYSFLTKNKLSVLLYSVLFLILLLGFYLYTQLVALPMHIDREKSASFRLNTWQEGATLFQKSPILGVGFNSYKFAISEYQLADGDFLKTRGASSNDSSLLFVLSTTGIVGFFAYLLFVLGVLNRSKTSDKLLFASVSALFLHSFFANSFFYPFILSWILLRISQSIKNS